jgi:diketogulonate reductase-like aldo/keto reductase
MRMLRETYQLSNGIKIPKIGFGTWQIPDGEVCYQAVLEALKSGYRHIDTAYVYQNEKSVGRAIKDSGIPREDIFVTSKLSARVKDYQGALDHFEQTMQNLDLAYLDLYLIHAPRPWGEDKNMNYDQQNIEVWKAFIKLYNDQRIRSIGVSNFSPNDIDNIVEATKFKPHVNQIAYFIGHNQKETDAYCKAHQILVEAYSPLALGKALANEEIQKMATKYQATPAQVCIRYCLQKETLPLPKTTHESRMIENAQVDFVIDEKDMDLLDQIEDDPRRK